MTLEKWCKEKESEGLDSDRSIQGSDITNIREMEKSGEEHSKQKGEQAQSILALYLPGILGRRRQCDERS